MGTSVHGLNSSADNILSDDCVQTLFPNMETSAKEILNNTNEESVETSANHKSTMSTGTSPPPQNTSTQVSVLLYSACKKSVRPHLNFN